MTKRRNLDTQGTGRRALNLTEKIIIDAGHLFQPIDGDIDTGIDGYVILRKKVKFTRIVKNKVQKFEDYVETGNIIGIQVKGVSEIPESGSNSYYVTYKDKKKFGVNFSTKSNLDKAKKTWRNFIGPVILAFVDLNEQKSWWTDLNSSESYSENDYCVSIQKDQIFNKDSFKSIQKLGRELFSKTEIPTIDTANHNFFNLAITGFKESAKECYRNLSGSGDFFSPTINPTLGEIKYSQSGWKHITRLNRRKMRIFNSLLLLGVSKTICEKVEKFSSVKKGKVRESERFIKSIDFLTLRANINFNFRQTAIVQVVLRRVKTFDKIHGDDEIADQIYFHSIYEPYRKE